ncbi:MAG: bifunctional 23S rRNA (guanine(2069)-N(7))-methyltransferase RlmK/23S rRNA (guanine(2445)-N(2))-methyltransferase RlmL [Myxococcota bacterium]
MNYDFVATAPLGFESLLADELVSLGIDAKVSGSVVPFSGTLEVAYRVCLWSRIAGRLLLPLRRFEAPDEDRLYEGVYSIDWWTHIHVDRTFAVQCVSSRNDATHTHYWALRTKDAICDAFRERCGDRPSVDTSDPDVRVHVYLEGASADFSVTVSLELSGTGLHRRGYRPRQAAAPLREHLAAALLLQAGYPDALAKDVPVIDPMCGSGTLLIEAACLAGGIAPGAIDPASRVTRAWAHHDEACFRELAAEASASLRNADLGDRIWVGSDASGEALEHAKQSAARAGLHCFRFEKRSLKECRPPEGPSGWVVVNPPWGERLGDARELIPLYQELGDVLRRRFLGYRALVLASTEAPYRHLGLKPDKRHVVYCGGIECRLLEIPIHVSAPKAEAPAFRKASDQAAPFRNRLRKNRDRLEPWASAQALEAYRIYDADIPEYDVAIDRYGSHVLVHERARPRGKATEMADRRLRDVMAVISEVLSTPPDHIHLRVRRRMAPHRQIERRSPTSTQSEGRSASALPADLPEGAMVIQESGHRFVVNLTEYMDTGIYLDQRRVRALIKKEAPGKRFLNLFAYTCTATVYAAAAERSVSVDLSNTYLRWAEHNFELNGVDSSRHRLHRADCRRYIEETSERFDLILLAPPSFSRSKAMSGDLDLMRDLPDLLKRSCNLLAPGGTLLFSAHLQKLPEVEHAVSFCSARELTQALVPRDFGRGCFRVFRFDHRGRP